MRAWECRSMEEANLLNPPFIGGLCLEMISGYCSQTKKEAPYVLPFLITPLVLHKKTRESLPSTVRTTFVSWTLSPEGTQAKATYAEHAKALVPIVKEGISFILKNDSLSITQNGNFVTRIKSKTARKIQLDFTDEVEGCFRRAAFCGRWLGRVGKIETTMALLGVKP